ncbi:MAG: DNA polymerase III subunit delta [bacterium]|nr:DNA polymerase III subunit delta [bacterium]
MTAERRFRGGGARKDGGKRRAPSPNDERRKALAAAASPTPPAVFLLFGEEDYLVEDTARRLVEALVPEAEREFGLEVVHGPGIPPGRVLDALGAAPLFGMKRTVWLRGCNLFPRRKRDGEEDLEEEGGSPAEAVRERLPRDGEGVTVIITEEKVDRRLALYREIGRRGVVCEFARLSETNDDHLRFIGEFAAERLRADGNRLSKNALLHLVNLAGAGLRTLLAEIEKLALYVGPGREIDTAAIDRLVSPRRESEVYLLCDAVMDRDRRRALDLLDRLLAQRLPQLAVAAALARRTRFMLQAGELLAAGIVRMPPGEATYPQFKRMMEGAGDRYRLLFRESEKYRNFNIFSQHPYVVYKTCLAARRIPLERLRRNLELVLRKNRAIKGERRSASSAIQELVISLCD